MAGRKTQKTPSFEEGLARLENIAESLEKSDLPLDELLKLYEEGVKLSADLTAKLDAAENRMQEIHAGRDDEPVITPTDAVQQQSMLDWENGGSL